MNAKLFVATAAVCAALFGSGCSSAPQALILGKWEVEGAPTKMTAEFDRDGTAKITVLGQTLQATYTLTGDELEWKINGMSTKVKANVTPTELDLTDGSNQTVKYKRR